MSFKVRLSTFCSKVIALFLFFFPALYVCLSQTQNVDSKKKRYYTVFDDSLLIEDAKKIYAHTGQYSWQLIFSVGFNLYWYLWDRIPRLREGLNVYLI